MTCRLSYLVGLVMVTGAMTLPCARAAKPASDLVGPEVRRIAVAKAEKIAALPAPDPLPEELPQPFSPPGFGRTGTGDTREGSARSGARGESAAPAAPATDSDALAAVAAKIPTTGTIVLGGKPLLISGTNKIEIGSRFTVAYNGAEYELELVGITSTTFTVRYKGEQYTRPILIKQGK